MGAVMRELSEDSALRQAAQFIQYASKGAQLDAFERWSASKDFGREDRQAIQEKVSWLLMAGNR